MTIQLQPIGWVRGGRSTLENDHWASSRCALELDGDIFAPEALNALDQFSHAEVIFYFDRVTDAEITFGAHHPRGRTDWPLAGIFAQRGKHRPNRLGVSVCGIVSVSGLVVEVEGLDAIDGTPILDIKPVLKEFLPRGALRQPGWASELMAQYW